MGIFSDMRLMSERPATTRRTRRHIHTRRVLAAVGLGVIVVAASYKPAPAPSSAAIPIAEAASLGWIAGPAFRIQIFATRDGTRYDVHDASGRRIAESVTQSELAERFPGININAMTASDHPPLMLADPSE
jgi:hypothetical protein